MRKIMFFCLLILATPFTLFAGLQESGKDDSTVKSSIVQLRSSNEIDRQAAKTKLLQLGTASIRPLISLLGEIIDDPSSRPMNGREKEWAEALEEYNSTEDPKIKGNALARRSNLSVTRRLKEDVIDLLSELKTEETIPIFIKLTWCCEIEVVGREDRWLSVMVALLNLGTKAVPGLIRAVETPDITPRSIPLYNTRLSTKESQRIVDQLISLCRKRAIMVLGMIGDLRALPVLRRLLEVKEDSTLAPYIEKAIKRIEMK